jgi:hypothetical protein
MPGRTWAAAFVVLASLFDAHAAYADALETTRFGGVLGVGISPGVQSLVAGALVQHPLSESVALGLELDFIGFHASYADRASKPRLLRLVPELSYRWEVLRLVPHIGLGAGYQLDFARSSIGGGVVAPNVGVDYLFSRTLRVGVAYRPIWYSNLRVDATQLIQHEVVLRFEVGSGW